MSVVVALGAATVSGTVAVAAGCGGPLASCGGRLSSLFGARRGAKDGNRDEFEQLLSFLHAVPLFRKQLPKAELPRLAHALRRAIWQPGDKVIEQGKEGKAFFIIFSGEASVMARDPGGEDFVRATLCTADHFGGRTLTERRPNIATVVAKGPAELVTYSLSRADFERLGLHRKLRLPRRPALYEGRRIGDLLWRAGGGVEPGSPLWRDQETPSDADVNLICSAVQENPNLRALSKSSSEAVRRMAQKARRRDVSKGTEIVQSGELGVEFYIIAQGSFDIILDRRCLHATGGIPDRLSLCAKHCSQSAEAAVGSNSMARRMVRKQQFLMNMIRAVEDDVPQRRFSESSLDSGTSHEVAAGLRRRQQSSEASSPRRRLRRRSEDVEREGTSMGRMHSKSFDSVDEATPSNHSAICEAGHTRSFHMTHSMTSLASMGVEEDVVMPGSNADVIMEFTQPPSRRSLKVDNVLWEEEDERPVLVMYRGGCLGELSMLYNTRQVATCRARENSVVYTISRAHFKECFKREGPHFDEYMNLLDDVHMLTSLLRGERAELARNAIGFCTFEPGEEVVHEGEERLEQLWYIVDRGCCIITKTVEQQPAPIVREAAPIVREVARLRRGGHFGERVILRSQKAYEISATAGPEGMTCLLFHGEMLKALRLTVLEGEENLTDSIDVVDMRNDACEYYRKMRSSVGAHHDIPLGNLETVGLLGQGGFGSVFLVKSKTGNTYSRFALKRMSKRFIAQADAMKQVCNEREILSMVDSPFIINFFQSYRDDRHVYMRLEYAPGGHLFRLMTCHSEALLRDRPGGSAAMFYVACAVLAMGYLHERHIAYRDLKLENVLLDSRGYAKLCDLGFARFILGKSHTLLGTPAYMAPEMIDTPHAHDQSVDWWALGVFTFELLTGQGPWDSLGIDMDEPMGQMLAFRLSHDRGVPPGLLPLDKASAPVRDFIKRLLCVNPQRRLGSNGDATEVKEHSWFSTHSFDFAALQRLELMAPHLPSELEEEAICEADIEQCRALWEEGESLQGNNSQWGRRPSDDVPRAVGFIGDWQSGGRFERRESEHSATTDRERRQSKESVEGVLNGVDPIFNLKRRTSDGDAGRRVRCYASDGSESTRGRLGSGVTWDEIF